MDAKSRACLIRHRRALERDIKTSYIMDCMVSDQVLTLQEEEKVKQQVESSMGFFVVCFFLFFFNFSRLLVCFMVLSKNYCCQSLLHYK